MTIRECVHLVTRVHFRSRDKDGGHTIRSAVPENPMLHTNITAVCFIELELLPIEILHRTNRNFRLFGSFHLDPMIFIYEFDLLTMEIYRMCKYELPTSRLSKVMTDIHTYRHTNIHIDRTKII